MTDKSNKMKLIDKHYEWAEKGEIANFSLTVLFQTNTLPVKYLLDGLDFFPFHDGVIQIPYTDTLQNIVLLICAMEGELE